MTALYGSHGHAVTASDLDVLSLVTGERAGVDPLGNHSTRIAGAPPARRKKAQSDRRPPVDPLMVAAAASAGPE